MKSAVHCCWTRSRQLSISPARGAMEKRSCVENMHVDGIRHSGASVSLNVKVLPTLFQFPGRTDLGPLSLHNSRRLISSSDRILSISDCLLTSLYRCPTRRATHCASHHIAIDTLAGGLRETKIPAGGGGSPLHDGASPKPCSLWLPELMHFASLHEMDA